jgi:hypothetical protein
MPVAKRGKVLPWTAWKFFWHLFSIFLVKSSIHPCSKPLAGLKASVAIYKMKNRVYLVMYSVEHNFETGSSNRTS